MAIDVQADFFEKVATVVEQARAYVGRTADLAMCVTYFEIGRMIVEREQGGKERAEYGRGLMRGLAEFLTNRFGHGFSLSTLKNSRQFHQAYSPQIRQHRLAQDKNSQTSPILSGAPSKSQTLFSQLYPFVLSWSHYLVLMRIKNSDSVVERTLPENSNIYASEYSLYLPDKGLLQRKLAEWIEEFEESRNILEVAHEGDNL